MRFPRLVIVQSYGRSDKTCLQSWGQWTSSWKKYLYREIVIIHFKNLGFYKGKVNQRQLYVFFLDIFYAKRLTRRRTSSSHIFMCLFSYKKYKALCVENLRVIKRIKCKWGNADRMHFLFYANKKILISWQGCRGKSLREA